MDELDKRVWNECVAIKWLPSVYVCVSFNLSSWKTTYLRREQAKAHKKGKMKIDDYFFHVGGELCGSFFMKKRKNKRQKTS